MSICTPHIYLTLVALLRKKWGWLQKRNRYVLLSIHTLNKMLGKKCCLASQYYKKNRLVGIWKMYENRTSRRYLPEKFKNIIYISANPRYSIIYNENITMLPSQNYKNRQGQLILIYIKI